MVGNKYFLCISSGEVCLRKLSEVSWCTILSASMKKKLYSAYWVLGFKPNGRYFDINLNALDSMPWLALKIILWG